MKNILTFVVFLAIIAGINCSTHLTAEPNNKTEAVIKGRVIYEDGRPAANLSYGYVSSDNFSPIDPMNQPKTNDRGEFVIEHILPDELFSFWIFPKENTLCVWKRLDPNSTELEFTLKTSEYIELPADWSMAFTHEAIARNMTFAKDSRIQFSLPDLHGNILSLEDQRFKNKAVLVNIYGSWCGGCKLEIPYLVNFKNKYQKDGLEIVGIAFESGSKEERLQAVRETAQKFKVNYPLLIGGTTEKAKVGTIINGLELFGGYPTTLYIGRDGLVKHIQVGFWLSPEGHKQWQIKQMEDHIKSLLGIITTNTPSRPIKNEPNLPKTIVSVKRKPGRVSIVKCDDGVHSYAVCLPSDYEKREKCPVIFCFDPGGNGKLAVRKFAFSAEKYGCIIVGSLDAKNGPWKTILKAQSAMLEDIQKRYKTDEKKYYAAGFSGGARMSYTIAYNNPSKFKGVIACGAGFGLGKISKDVAVYHCVGNADSVGMFEVKKTHSELQRNGVKSQLNVFSGGHKWPPDIVIKQALDWLI